MTKRPDPPDAAWFAAVLDAMEDLVLVKGPRSRLLWANRTFRDCYGMSNDELRSLVDGEHIDPDDTLQYVRDDRRVFVERAVIDVPSEPVTDHHGETRFFHTLKSPVFDESGDVAMQVGVSRAIPEDDAAERSRHRRERDHASTRNVRALVHSLPAPIVMLDAAHRIIMWNDAFERVVDGSEPGCSSRLLHTDYEEALEGRLPLLEELDAVLHGAEPTGRVLELGDANGGANGGGRTRSFRVDCRTWNDASENVCGTFAVFHDITGLVANERRLRDANEELAQFNYRVSHDIVAPISTARGCLELAIEEAGDEDPDGLVELMTVARGQLDKLDELVADLSSLARADAEGECRETVDLEALVDALRGDALAANGEGVVIDTDLVLERLRSDPRRIRQMLSNLIDNARKYRDPAENAPRVTVRSRREDDAFVLEVSDNGVGIDPGFGERAFEMFTRGTSMAPGTGLGLYIISKHADRLGGTLSIASHAKPTVMRIVLPGACEAAA